MKRFNALILALFAALSLVACGDSGIIQNTSITTEAALLQGDAVSTHTDVSENMAVDIKATNVYVLNTDSGYVLYQKNCDDQIAPASTAKMLTALTVLDYCPPTDTFTVGAEIDLIAADSSRAWLNHGDTLTVKQLLVAMLLPSGNDAAFTLAVNVGKILANDDSLEAMPAIEIFVNAMNQKAQAVGATASYFINPDGYDAGGQYTTAFDLAQIAKACIGNDILAEIMGSYKIYDSGQDVVYYNTNELLNPHSQYFYSKATGLKTGTTEDAGSCLVAAAAINGQTYICVVMGSSAETRFTDCLTVFRDIDPTMVLPAENDSAPVNTPGRLGR